MKVSAPRTPADQNIGVGEAVQAAGEILDRLETSGGVAPDDPLLDEVRRYIEIVDTREPANAWLTFLQGRVLALSGRPRDASDQLLRFVETTAGKLEWKAFRILGDLFVEEYARLAKARYKTAASLNPGEPTILFGQSVCAMKLGATTEAVEFAREAVAADGRRTVRYLSQLASVLVAAKQWDGALREADRALELAQQQARAEPGSHKTMLVVDAQYRLLVSILYRKISRPGVSPVDDYLRLATSVRRHAGIAEKLAVYDVLTVVEEGIEETAPNTPPVLLREYGALLAEVGRTADAIAVFERLLQTDSTDIEAAEWLDRLRSKPSRDR